MVAIPPVLAATAPAPENFRSLRRSIRVMVFPPYHPEALRCIGGSLKPTVAWHKPAPPNWWGRRLKGQVRQGIDRPVEFLRFEVRDRLPAGEMGSNFQFRGRGTKISIPAPFRRGSSVF